MDGREFIHVTMHAKWSKSVRARFMRELDVLLEYVSPIYALIEPSNHKLKKFSRLCGFTHRATGPATDGRLYEVYERN